MGQQRHPWGNKEGGRFFIKRRDTGTLVLRGIVGDFDTNGVAKLKDHELDYDRRPRY